jgi:hypothetical protein
LLENQNLPNTSSAAVNDILPNRNITEITDRWPGLEGIPEIYMNQEGLFYLWNAGTDRKLLATGQPPSTHKSDFHLAAIDDVSELIRSRPGIKLRELCERLGEPETIIFEQIVKNVNIYNLGERFYIYT